MRIKSNEIRVSFGTLPKVACLFLLTSCSDGKLGTTAFKETSVKAPSAQAAAGDGQTNVDPSKSNGSENQPLSLVPLNFGQKTLDSLLNKGHLLSAGKQQHLNLLSSARIAVVDKSGLTSTFNSENKQFGVPAVSNEAPKFDEFYNLLDDGWVAFKDNRMSFLHSETSTLASYDLPFEKESYSIKLLSKESALFQNDNEFKLVRLENGEAKLVSFPSLPESFTQVSPCAEGCAYWAFDGESIWTTDSLSAARTTSWTNSSVKISAPGGKKIESFMTSVSLIEGKTEISGGIALGNEHDHVWRVDVKSAPKTASGWDRVKLLSQNHCVPCHESDGYLKEVTWQENRTVILSRIDTVGKTVALPMPIPSSVYGEKFTDKMRADMVSWLNAQTGEEKVTPGGVIADPNAANTPISGELKVVAEKHCTSCHMPLAANVEWYVGNRDEITRRVESGDMPRGAVMPNAERMKLLSLIPAE